MAFVAGGVAAVLALAMQHSMAAIAKQGLFRIFMLVLVVVYGSAFLPLDVVWTFHFCGSHGCFGVVHIPAFTLRKLRAVPFANPWLEPIHTMNADLSAPVATPRSGCIDLEVFFCHEVETEVFLYGFIGL